MKLFGDMCYNDLKNRWELFVSSYSHSFVLKSGNDIEIKVFKRYHKGRLILYDLWTINFEKDVSFVLEDTSLYEARYEISAEEIELEMDMRFDEEFDKELDKMFQQKWEESSEYWDSLYDNS